ncbi:hypothetical protein IFM89_004111 [Coptis chinensis]|uniref:Rhamnogalacturonan lyase domain-containing protein n=1 Tax=Coptis chinensis TaxID=261450 RepID=A0A835LDF4_9MAGN|nr:hypothetical protein IFM89_004111 [Coptis chinensis]
MQLQVERAVQLILILIMTLLIDQVLGADKRNRTHGISSNLSKKQLKRIQVFAKVMLAQARSSSNSEFKGEMSEMKSSIARVEGVLMVRVNDPKANPPLFSSGVIGKDNSIARHGIHGLYWLFNADVPGAQLVEGKNTVFLTQPQAHTSWQEIMYDYIRLEGPPSSGLKNIANEYFEWMKRKCLMESEQHTRSEQSCSPSRPSEVQYANEDTSHSPAYFDMDMEDESQQPNEDLRKSLFPCIIRYSATGWKGNTYPDSTCLAQRLQIILPTQVVDFTLKHLQENSKVLFRQRMETVGLKSILTNIEYGWGHFHLRSKQPWHMIVRQSCLDVQDAFVLCGVFRKSGPGPKNGEHYGAPLIEEEWDDNNVVFPKSEFDHDCTLDGFDEYVQAQQGIYSFVYIVVVIML